MRFGIRAALALALAAAVAPAALAGQTGTPGARDTAARQPNDTVEPPPARLALADTLMRELHADTLIHAAMKNSFDAMIRQQPALAMYRDVFDAWAAKYLTWNQFGPPMMRVYAQEFTDDELRTLIGFYATPVGQKLALAQPDLMRRGAEVGRSLGEKYAPQLQEMIRERLSARPDSTR